MIDVGPGTVEGVDDTVDGRLVPGDHRRGEHDGVGLFQLHPLVLLGGHQGKRRVRLPLRAGADHDHTPWVERFDLLDRDDVAVGHLEKAELAGGGDARVHRPPQKGNDALALQGFRALAAFTNTEALPLTGLRCH